MLFAPGSSILSAEGCFYPQTQFLRGKKMTDSYKLPLYGDGVHDDSDAIQERLDSGISCVELPPTDKCYLISKTLKIHSNQELRLQRATVIRLAPESDCTMLENAGGRMGDRNVFITGGIWDFANVDQFPNPMQLEHVKKPLTRSRPEKYSGTAMEFRNVSGFRLQGVIFRNPTIFAATFHKVTNFVMDDIEFDFTTCNPAWANMDGIHLNGSCAYGRISNLRGNCYDDLVALNSPEGDWPGPITDIDIDGIQCDSCHSAIRLLSYTEPVRRISIRNIHGNFYRYMVGITHFVNDQPGPGIFDDITIENCYCGKCRKPEGLWDLMPMAPILVEGFCDVGDLYIGNIHRDEFVENVPCIACNVDSDRPVIVDTKIRNLTVENCSMTNHLPEELEFFHCDCEVESLTFRNNQCYSAPGAGPCILKAGKFPEGK